MVAGEASETALRGQCKVTRPEQRFELMLNGSKVGSAGRILPPGAGMLTDNWTSSQKVEKELYIRETFSGSQRDLVKGMEQENHIRQVDLDQATRSSGFYRD
jgi:hypothetical protein